VGGGGEQRQQRIGERGADLVGVEPQRQPGGGAVGGIHITGGHCGPQGVVGGTGVLERRERPSGRIHAWPPPVERGGQRLQSITSGPTSFGLDHREEGRSGEQLEWGVENEGVCGAGAGLGDRCRGGIDEGGVGRVVGAGHGLRRWGGGAAGGELVGGHAAKRICSSALEVKRAERAP